MIRIGTSGWNYPHWRRTFYPQKLPSKEWLHFYAGQFRTVEINNSFYRLPQKDVLEKWRESVPDSFIFAAKASRFITHMKKLKDSAQTVPNFMKSIKPLGKYLGPILFQLPPRWHFDRDRLAAFSKCLPKEYKYALEFRDATWWNDDAYQILKDHDLAFCIYDLAGKPSPLVVTSKMVYIRFHGPAGLGHYDDRTLAKWAESISEWDHQRHEVFCYFNNDAFGHAVRDAIMLKKILSKG